MWFGPSFTGLEVQFSGRCPSVWKLEQQISEHADFCSRQECEDLDDISEARAVFLCSKVDGYGPQEAIMKVFMQIPWMGTEMQPKEQRSIQRGTSESAYYEADALEALTKAKSSSTPTLLAVKTTTQPSSMWINGGYLGFVLMTRLPGQPLDRIEDLSLKEREELRQSFKKAWIECYAAGIVPGDYGLRNLLWDSQKRKCYIVDFGMWYPTNEYPPWRDGLFKKWGLMRYTQGGKLEP
ncbi:hypothetical protein FQN54_002078 [Arachnomyces sp. PD_36]|nr:hypothetical protein FQN54_002078 [Arachnomyces sp. PD_36]